MYFVFPLVSSFLNYLWFEILIAEWITITACRVVMSAPAGPCRNSGGQSGNGTDFSLNISIFAISTIPPILYTHSFIHSFITDAIHTLQFAAPLNKTHTHTPSSVSLPPHGSSFKSMYLTHDTCALLPPWRSRHPVRLKYWHPTSRLQVSQQTSS